MARAKRLPSGTWRIQITLDGKRKSITRSTQAEAEYTALEYQLGYKREVANITVGKAIDDYIDSKDGVLSPSTIAGYRKIRRCNLQPLMAVPLSSLSDSVVQKAFNAEAKRISARGGKVSRKSLANARGLLSAALKPHNLRFEPTIPAKQKQMKELLTPQQIFAVIEGSNVELPCLLAMCLSLSMSEIRGLTVKDIGKDSITVAHSIVDVDGVPTKKDAMKAYERARKIKVPSAIMELIHKTNAWEAEEGNIITESGQLIYRRWKRLLRIAGLPHMRFHDLRHVNASVMLLLGIPDKYAMERGGWKTNSVMKDVYQHTYSAERDAAEAKINAYFEAIIAHENAHGSP